MFIFRRIPKSDRNLKFSTGDEIFNDFNPDGTLLPFVKANLISGGDFLTYLLIRKEEFDQKVYGILRYSLSSIKNLINDLEGCKENEVDLDNLESTYKKIKSYI